MALLRVEPLPRNVTPGELLRFVAELGKIDGKQVGKITLLGPAATVEVPDAAAGRVVAATDGATFRERPVRVRLAAGPKGDGSSHFDRLSRLLDLDATAESEQAKRRAALGAVAGEGTALTHLVIADDDIGLGGRLILTLTRKNRNELLPPNRLGPGAPVLLTQTGTNRPISLRGVVSFRTDRAVEVAFELPDESLPDDAPWRLDLSPDEVSRQRQQAAMNRAKLADGDRLSELRDAMFSVGRVESSRPAVCPSEADGGSRSSTRPTEDGLNPTQLAAVEFALSANDVAVIHGPPGTGKTTTVVELIRRAVARGEKVLTCAPSNAAVDNLLEKLLAAGLEPVRLGHPARVAADLRDRALDLLVQSHPDARQARRCAKEARALFRKADKWTKAKPLPGERQALRAEAKALLTDGRRMEQLAVDRLLDDATVVCATLTGADSEDLGRRRFDLVVIDEACQATEPASWVPILRAGRLVLAGDPCQLPPTVVSPEAAGRGLAISLMERVMADLGSGVSRLLSVQYRMHADIMRFPNAEFYADELVADPRVIRHRLCDLPTVRVEPLTEEPVLFLDTAGAGYDEEPEEDTDSRRNPREAGLAARYVRRLLDAGLTADQVAVIAPYAGQVRLLREQLRGTGVEVDSVDGFQGREKEAVVISMVRSNPEGEIGFLADTRRTNVALSRARRKLVVIGDSATLSNHEFYQRMLAGFERGGAYRSVWEEPE